MQGHTLRAQMQASLTRAARSAPLKPWQCGLAPTAATSTSTARGVLLVRACRMAPLPSGGGKGTYRILSSLPGLQCTIHLINADGTSSLALTEKETAIQKRKEKFTLFCDHNGSLQRQQPGGITPHTAAADTLAQP